MATDHRQCVVLLLLACISAEAGVVKFNSRISSVLREFASMSSASSQTSSASWPPAFCHGLSCPKYSVLKQTQDYELREYDASQWVSSTAMGINPKSTRSTLFRRMFNYIQGLNSRDEKIAMTAPVLTKLVPGQGPACEDTYTMSFFLQPEMLNPPQPKDSTVFLSKLPAQRVYVRSFGGFADTESYVMEAGKLAEAIGDDSKYRQDYYYTAGYDGPNRLINRHNEIWFVAV